MARARHLSALLRDACSAAGFVASFPVVGTLVGMVCGDAAGDVRNFDDAKRTDEAAYAAFFQAMLAEGVAMAPGAYEAIFVGLGHTDQVLASIGDAAFRAAATAQRVARGYVGLVRQLFSWRFVAAIAALGALALLTAALLVNDDSLEEVIEAPTIERRIDLIEPIAVGGAIGGLRGRTDRGHTGVPRRRARCRPSGSHRSGHAG